MMVIQRTSLKSKLYYLKDLEKEISGKGSVFLKDLGKKLSRKGFIRIRKICFHSYCVDKIYYSNITINKY